MADSITVNLNAAMAVLTALQQRLNDQQAVLKVIGEDQVDRIKARFDAGSSPDGVRWAANSEVTIARYVAERGGYSKKTGDILKKGEKLQSSKKPLRDHGDLARQFSYVAGPDFLGVYSTMPYAFMQHFGGIKGEFPQLWGDIPARPFFPIRADHTLYPDEETHLVGMLADFIREGKL